MARLLALLVGAGLSAYRSLFRIETLHEERYHTLRESGRPILFALWHGRMFCPILWHRKQDVITMASRSKDGEVIARWLLRNGYRVVRGSTLKGGKHALEEMQDRLAKEGGAAALTVDGPKGPAGVVKPGVVHLARETGAWILPITYASTRPRRLSSWDRYLLPRLLSRNVVAYGEPFPIDRKMPAAEAVEKITQALNRITDEVDAYVAKARG